MASTSTAWELPKARFRRLMQEVVDDCDLGHVVFKEEAVEVLKSVSEEVVTGLLTKAMAAAEHRGRKTLMLKDFSYVVGATNTHTAVPDLARILPVCLDG